MSGTVFVLRHWYLKTLPDMNATRLLITVFATILLLSCKTKIDCPAFDNTVLNAWFPYQEGQTIYFTSEPQRIDTLSIAKVSATGPHTIEYGARGNEKGYKCDVQGLITSTADYGEHPGWVALRVQHYQEPPKTGSYTYNGIKLNFRGVADVELFPNDGFFTLQDEQRTIVKYTDFEINGNVYGEVCAINTIDKVLAEKEGVDVLYIAKGVGIVGYKTYPDGALYSLQ